MKALAAPRWAISFADLGLVLLGCFMMLHAMTAQQARPAGAAPALPTLADYRAIELFEAGEARLIPSAREMLRELGRGARGSSLVVTSRGVDAGGARLDSFELAAARAAAVARALREAGVDEERIDLNMLPDAPGGQRIRVGTAG